MTERLTEHKTTKGITRIVIKPYVAMSEEAQPIADKLCAFEDILEKYGIENVDTLEHIIKKGKVITSTIEGFAKEAYNEIQADRDTWKRTCELACSKLVDYEWDNKESTHSAQYWLDYFYQQAKKDGDDE